MNQKRYSVDSVVIAVEQLETDFFGAAACPNAGDRWADILLLETVIHRSGTR